MARAPDERQEQAKELFLQGMKLIDISKALRFLWGRSGAGRSDITGTRNPMQRCISANATLRKQKAVNEETKTLLETMAALPRKEIKTQLRQESSKLSF